MASGKAEKSERAEKSDYRLLVSIVEARQLASKDRNGLSDPYCVLTMGKTIKKTKVIKANLSPRWDEHNDVKAPLTLNVQVWDKDTFRPDDFLGQFDMVLNGSDKPTELDQWFPLEGRGKDEVISGEVHVKVLMESYADLQKRYAPPVLK